MEPRIIKILLTVFLVTGALVLILGCVLGFVVLPNIIEDEIIKNVELEVGTKQYERFVLIPFPIAFKVTFFTIANPSSILTGAVPRVVERGPYVYDEIRKKGISYLRDDDIGYNEEWSFKFNSNASKGLSDDDTIIVVNAPLIAIMQKLEDLPLPLPISLDQLLNEIFENTDIFMEIKVKDLAFGGIKMCDTKRTVTSYTKFICLTVMIMKQKLLEYHDDRSMSFSLFGYKTQPDGPFEIKRGIKNVETLGLITSYNRKQYTDYWNGKRSECDKVEGRYTSYPPFMKKDTTYKVYSTDICKSTTVNYVSTSQFKGVDGYRFETDINSFSSPSQTCACIKETKDIDGTKNCFDKGLLDLHNCFGGSPVILSFPHLMWADEKYQKSVIGLNPNYTEDHNSFLEFEPHLGVPLRGSIRIQFNIIMRPTNYGKNVIESTKDLTPAMLPILWLEDSFELTDDLIQEINEELLDQLILVDIITWVFIGVGIVILTITIAACIVRYSRNKTSSEFV